MALTQRTKVIYVLFGFLIISLTEAKTPDLSKFMKSLPPFLPTPLEYVEKYYNKTQNEINKIVKDWKYFNVNCSKIKYLQYSADGSYREVDAKSANIIESQQIKVVYYGHYCSGAAPWIRGLAKSYHQIGMKNVLTVEWTYYSKQDILTASLCVKGVGECSAAFLYDLVNKDNSKLRNIHLIGHSIGVHAAGLAGRHMQRLSRGTKIGRITSLEAGAPFFEYPKKLSPDLRISEQDAEFVDGIHTCAGYVGFSSAYATQDHYVNFGGPVQLACLDPENVMNSALSEHNVDMRHTANFDATTIIYTENLQRRLLKWWKSINIVACSHEIAYDIFIKTITSTKFISTKCSSPLLLLTGMCARNPKVIMGEHNNGTDLEGEFYLDYKDASNNGVWGFYRNYLEPADIKQGRTSPYLNMSSIDGATSGQSGIRYPFCIFGNMFLFLIYLFVKYPIR